MLKPQDRAMVNEFVAVLSGALGPDLRSVIVYGSRARGDAHPRSDLDVLVLTACRPGFDVQRTASSIAYDLWERMGFEGPEVQPVVVWESEYQDWLARDLAFASNVEHEGQSAWPTV